MDPMLQPTFPSSTHLAVEPYARQIIRWPSSGRHILAAHDADTIVVYQAYAEDIARYAVQHQRFGGRFSLQRMSWIKPNFLWMMDRSGWATKPGQERVLAVRLSRTFFDHLLACAVVSSFQSNSSSHEEWRRDVAASEVRLQWDPDHDPAGGRLARRALQLGLRAEALRCYATAEPHEIVDVTPFVREQHAFAVAGDHAPLLTPREDVYLPADLETRRRVGLDD